MSIKYVDIVNVCTMFTSMSGSHLYLIVHYWSPRSVKAIRYSVHGML